MGDHGHSHGGHGHSHGPDVHATLGSAEKAKTADELRQEQLEREESEARVHKIRNAVIGVVVASAAVMILCGVAFGVYEAPNIAGQFAGYSSVATALITGVSQDDNLMMRFSKIVDLYGPRFPGSKALETTTEWVYSQMKTDGFEVTFENVTLRRWQRNQDSAILTLPTGYKRNLPMLALEGSVPTAVGGIQNAAVIVLNSVEAVATSAVSGKIVVFNVPMSNFHSYADIQYYYHHSPNVAAQNGALAVLLRSPADISYQTPHVGYFDYEAGTDYDVGAGKIPAATITVEDAAMLARVQALDPQGIRITLTITSMSPTPNTVVVRNIIADLKGSSKADEYVVLTARLDSPDVGGAANAAGLAAAWGVMSLLKKTGNVPLRTVRLIAAVGHDQADGGMNQFVKNHPVLDKYGVVIPAPEIFNYPAGFLYTGSESTRRIFRDLLTNLNVPGDHTLTLGTSETLMRDILPITNKGVPSISITTNVTAKEFYSYDHSDADTIDRISLAHLEENVAAMAVMTYALGSMSESLPR